MNNDKDICENIYGCVPICTCITIIILMVLCSCRSQQKIVEVEKWSHDTTTVVDTVYVKDIITMHDSIYVTEYVTHTVKDSMRQDVAWKYYTYDPSGNVMSLLDYTSTAQGGSESKSATESASTVVGSKGITHEEKGSHIASSGRTEAMQSKEQTKTGLSNWQKFVMLIGYLGMVVLGVAIMLGGLRLYGRKKEL